MNMLAPVSKPYFEVEEPYGDVRYADPGYRDNRKRYPIDTPAHVRAAWAYINMPKNSEKYTSEQLDLIKGRIRAAAEKHGIQIAESRPHEGPGSMGMAVPYRSTLLAGVTPLTPPSSWFTAPDLHAPTRLTISSDGHVFGHLAQWQVCHIGIGDSCVMAPRSQTGYNFFKIGTVVCDDGKEVPIGKIVMGAAHANAQWGVMPSREHYDNIALTAAIVNVGEDRHGIWVNGALTTDMTPEKIAALRASALSGDWRTVNGHLELIAALAVNSPGFPIYRQEAGRAFSMQAVGVLGLDENEESGEFAMSNATEEQEFVTPPTGIAEDEAANERKARFQEIDASWEQHRREQRFAQLAVLDAKREELADTLPVTKRDSLAIRAEWDAKFRQIPEEEYEDDDEEVEDEED